MTLADRLAARTDKGAPDGCWIWTGARRRDGYGAIAIGGGHRSIVRSPHRVAWELAHGPVPAGLFVLHACDVKLCVNPSHLMLGTARANAIDSARKGRNVMHREPERVLAARAARGYETNAKGETHGRSRLREPDIREIRFRHGAGEPATQIAPDFGVSPTTIRSIAARLTWRHVA